MSDKSPLEKDIERRELLKVPFSVVLFIALLLVCVGVLGFYVYTLRQELTMKRQDITLLKRDFNKKESKFTNEILRLERENGDLKLRLESQKDKSPAIQNKTTPEKETTVQ
jgi:Tfp pilus assembly protein PilN